MNTAQQNQTQTMNIPIAAVCFDDNNDLILVTGEFELPCKGARDKYGAQMEPDSPDKMHLIDATSSYGMTVTLNAAETQRAIDALWEAVEGPQD